MSVLFADITESTKLYQDLGDVAARNVVAEVLAIMEKLLPDYQGHLVKTLGDAVFAVFPTADLGVLAASHMQAAITERRPGDYPVSIHIGLHYGPVLVEDGDIFGDTVNAAAYLAAVAMRDQVLTTEAMQNSLSDPLKSLVRPVFNSVLKGSTEESTVYQVLWRKDRADITDVNLHSNKLIPGDTGSLLVSAGEDRVRVDQWRPEISIGRGADCDLVINDKFASRQHLSIKLMRTHFYLIDHSINGTFVELESGAEVHVLRGELLLDGSGHIYMGRSRTERPEQVITFTRDRRSMYRV